jgi:hypothetical protein
LVTIHFDTSAITKRYDPTEAGAVARHFGPAPASGNRLALSALTSVRLLIHRQEDQTINLVV